MFVGNLKKRWAPWSTFASLEEYKSTQKKLEKVATFFIWVYLLGRNVLVAASGCGWLYIFDMSKYGDEVDIEPTYRQRVPANIRQVPTRIEIF